MGEKNERPDLFEAPEQALQTGWAFKQRLHMVDNWMPLSGRVYEIRIYS